MSSELHVPSNEELRAELLILKSENPTLGIVKTHARLLSTHPGWSVSEKRLRKVIKELGNNASSPNGDAGEGEGDPTRTHTPYPTSRVIEKLDVGKWTNKVQVRYFSRKKGKGLVVKERIETGEVIWKEDPFVIAPEWEIYDLQQSSSACSFCTTPFTGTTNTKLITTCPFFSPSSCPARFCNRLCLSRSAKTHPLLCSAQNPASAPLLAYARRNTWMALHALAQCTSRIMLSAQVSDEAVEDEWGIVRGFAEMGMEERFKSATWSASSDTTTTPEPDRAPWKKAHQLYVQAFQDPPGQVDKKRLAKILKKPLKEAIAKEMFEYDAFLRGLGRMSLNLTAHGGVYTLHSHLNHSCRPNTVVRHLEQRISLSRITVIARCPIEIGEELFVTYVDPALGVKERRQELRQWGFGDCDCAQCMKEEEALKAVSDAGGTEAGMIDLERELKAGLGLT